MPSFTGEPSHWVHASVNLSPKVKLHYVDVQPASPAAQTLVLIHGYPETWYAYRHVIQPLADLGYRVIVPDYRGAGDSNKPVGGYDKMTMASDIYKLWHDHLKVDKAVIIGHDIGSMVAVCLALQYRSDVSALICMGTETYDRVTTDETYTYGGLFHFFFHTQPDLPELLTQGKEREYIAHFYDRLCSNPGFLKPEDLELYAQSFARAGAMRAGFECYRAFRQDRTDYREHLKQHGKIALPVLALAGDNSIMKEVRFPVRIHADTQWFEEQTKEFATDVTFDIVTGANHWLAEENPKGFMRAVQQYLSAR